MPKKYWWEEGGSQTSKQTNTQSNTKKEKKYWWEDDTNQESTQGNSSGHWWDDNNYASMVGDDITNKVNAWLNKHNSYLSEYQKRYEGRKYSYEDAYVGDSAEWLASVGKKKSEFDAEADSIISYIDENKGYLNQDWIDQVKYAITSARGTQNQLIASAKKDNEYWNSFGSEDLVKEYGSAEEAYKYYQRADGYGKKYDGLSSEDLRWAAGMLEAGEEKDWVNSYASTVDYNERANLNLDAAQKDLNVLADTFRRFRELEWSATTDEEKAELEQLRQQYNSSEELWNTINQKSDYLDNAKEIQKWNSYAQMPGFYSASKEGKKMPNNVVSYSRENYNKIMSDVADRVNTKGNPLYINMSQDEVDTYSAILATDGEQTANAYLQFLMPQLESREVSRIAGRASERPVLGSLYSVGTSLGSAAEYLVDVGKYATDKLFSGEKVRLDSNYNAEVTNAIRGAVSDKVDWKIGNWDAFDFVYNTVMSGIDSAAAMALGGAGGAVLGLSAAAQGTNDALNRGMNSTQAFWNGLASGVFEGLFESLSIGNFKALKETAIDIPLKGLDKNVIKTIAKNLGKTMLTNASEEAATEIANIMYDTLVNGEFANYTLEELMNGAWKDAALQVAEAAGSGALMGFGFGAVGNTSAVRNSTINKYGAYTGEMIQQGLENDPKSKSYKLAQKYEKKTSKDRNLTAHEIRSLLAANNSEITKSDMQKIQSAAEKRLTSLGQTEDVQNVAELATKYATGGKLTRAETSFLANSKYGSRVANELLPENIASGDYSTEWAENIGTKQVNFGAYNIRAIVDEMLNKGQYKSLESRMEGETPAKVSDTGKAVIRGTDEEIDLTNPTFKQISDDGVVLEADGKTVNSNEIDYDSEDQGIAINAIGKIEHITPEVASALYAKLDMTKPVMKQLNGIDEAFTYGYYNYSEADLEAGTFTGNLTKDQLNEAYKLGQYVRKNDIDAKADAFKAMRTAADAIAEKNAAEGKEAPGAKNLTITYKNVKGEAISFDEENLSPRQSGGVEWAKILHKMGLGTKVEFFESYISDTMKVKDKKTGKMKAARVFINDTGAEQIAYSGVYRKRDGTIRIDLNAYNGKGFTLNALAHELTHFIQQWSDKKYKVLVDFLMKEYENTDMTMHERVLREQKRLQDIRGEEVSYDEAYDEVVANAMNKMFDDGKMAEKLAKLKEQDKNLAQKLWEGFKEILAKFMGLYKNEGLFWDADVLDEMKETFDQLQNMFAEALVEASENYQASLITKEAGIEIMPVEDGTQYSYSSLAEAAGFVAVENEDGTRSFTRDGKKVSKVTVEDIDNSPIGAFISFSLEMGDISEADAKRQKQMFADICTMACKTNDFAMTMQFVGSAVFTGMKANADKQYGTTYDFPSICTKTQAVIDAMSAKMMSLGRGLNTDEIVQLYNDVFASGNPVPCPECYVFSRWIGIGGLLDNIKKYQDYYGDMDVKDVAAAYLKMKAEVSKFADEQGISFGKAKGALTSKLTKEFNKLTEKIEKNENQGENVKASDRQRLAELEPMMNTVKSMTWLENVYFADSSLKKVNPNFRVPDSVLFDLNNGEAFATKYKEAWAFRTTQGAGYGKAITPYAEARLGEGVLVTNNTTNAIKGKAQGSLNNYFLNQMGKLDKQSRDALKRARLKQKIQAFLGGQRFQSTSDARYENASDYLLAALEMQAMGGMVQCYTKVDGAVPAFSAWGFSINQSLMPLNGGLDANGNVKDTGVGGMKPSVAFENRNKYESAGTITIGVNDNHIRAMFKQWVRDFIIPYHASGGKADVVAAFRSIQEGKEAKGKAVRSTDYSRTQGDKVLSDDVLRWQGKTDAQIQRIHEIRNARIAILTGGKPNMTVVRSNRFLSALYDKFNGGEWDGVKIAKSKVESQIFPNEFWDQTVTYEESAKITKDYLEYCEDLGFLHRFSGMVPSNGKLVPVNGYNENGERVQLTDLAYKYDEKGNKTAEVEEFFWKVLTDRRMYDNNGNYLAQKVVTLNDTTTETVTGFAKNNQGREYDKAKAEALAQKIANGEQYSSQETDYDQEFDYSGLNWATDLGIITEKDRAIFERTINNEIFRGAKPQSANGEYIIDTGKCLMFTDGDFHTPTLTRVIEFVTEYESLTADAKEMIFDEAEATGEVQKSIEAIKKMFGHGFVSVRNQPLGRSYGRQNRGRKGSDRSGAYQRAKSLKERYAEEGLSNLLEDEDSYYFDALNRGDMETVQRIVDETANDAGFTTKGYHGSRTPGFTVVDKYSWLWLARDESVANSYGTRTKVDNKNKPYSTNGVYAMHYNLGNNLVVYADGASWGELPVTEDEYPGVYVDEETGNITTNAMAEWAERNGYDSITFVDVDDGGLTTVDVVFNPNRDAKSADPITYNDAGKVIPLSKRYNKFNDDLRYSSQETDADYIKYDRTAILKESKVDEYLNDYAAWSSPKYAQAYITYMRPRDFLKLTTTGVVERFYIDEQAGKLDEERLSDSRPGIYLRIDHKTGKVVGHEGRHRMSAMGYAGVDRVPVLLLDESNNMTKTDIDRLYLHGQFDETEMSVVTDAIPLSVENRSRVIEKFATQSANQKIGEKIGYNKTLRFSEHDTDYSNRSLLANAFEGITKDSIEYTMIQDYKGHIQVLNMLDKRLSVLNDQIHDIRFTKGKYDAEKLRELESEREEVINEINRYDKMLLNLEASEPLRKVIVRERKKEAQKTKAHVQEIQQNKKVRAEQTELRHKIRKSIRDLDKILNRGNKKVNVKDDLQPVVTKALQAAEILFTDNYGNYDMLRNGIGAELSDAEEALVETCAKMLKDLDKMPTNGYENFQARQEAENKLKTKMAKLKDVFARERKRLNNTKVSSILGELADAYKSLETSDQSYVQGAYIEAVHSFLKNLQNEVGGTVVSDMTKDQLENVYAAYKMVLTTVRKANQLFAENIKETKEQLAGAILTDFATKRAQREKNAATEAVYSVLDSIGWNNEKLPYAMRRIGSESFSRLLQNIIDGEDITMRDVTEAIEFRAEMDKKYGFNSWDYKKKYEFTSKHGQKFELDLQQLMSFYAYSKREGAHDHITNGGIVLNTKKLLRKKKADAYALTEEGIVELVNTLTAEQKSYVDEMQKYLSEVMGAKGNEVSMQMYGIKMFNEESYFPIRSSEDYLARAAEANLINEQGMTNLASAGFTKALTPKASTPIVLEGFIDTWADHVNEMSRYHGFVLPMEDFRKVLNYSTYGDDNKSIAVNAEMKNTFGEGAKKYFNDLYRELNAGAAIDRKGEEISRKLISRVKKNAVVYSLSVIFQQPTAIVRAGALIDRKYFGRVLGSKGRIVTGFVRLFTKQHKKLWEEMKQYAPGVVTIKEIGGFDTTTGGSILSALKEDHYKGLQENFKAFKEHPVKWVNKKADDNILARIPTYADQIAWVEIWNAVKRETLHTHKDMATSSKEFLEICGKRFSEVIRMTQVYDSVFAKSPYLRSKSLWMQSLTSFMAEPNTTINMVEDGLREIVRGNWKYGTRAIHIVINAIIFNGLAKSIIYAMRDDDEDETYIEKYLEAFTSSMLDDLNPFNYIPIAKDVWNVLSGYGVERMDMSMVTDIVDTLERIKKLGDKETEDMTEEQLAEHEKAQADAWWGLADALSALIGYPIKNIRRDAMGIYNTFFKKKVDMDTTKLSLSHIIENAYNDSLPVFLRDESKSKNDKLYDAIISGDKEYLARLKSTYKTDSAYQSAVVKALRENDPRIKEAAQAGVDGNSEERNRIFKEIKAELGAEYANLIIEAINAEASKIRNDAKPDKVTGKYEAYDFVAAVSNGDAETAKTVREDIIDTYKDNGKSQVEAEKAFVSDVEYGIEEAYSYDLLDQAGAEKMLMEYADMDEEDATSRVDYWDFCNENPKYANDISEAKYNKYKEFAEPAGISVDVYAQFLNGTKDLADIKDEWGYVVQTEQDQVIEIIDFLPLTKQQKDALFLAYGYKESSLWKVSW